MNANQRLKLVNKALEEWMRGKLSDVAALTAIALVSKRQPKPTWIDIDWAKRIIAKYKIKDSRK